MVLSCRRHKDVMRGPHTDGINKMLSHTMQAPRSLPCLAPGLAGPGSLAAPGYDGRLRDADWRPSQGGGHPVGAPILYRWRIPAGVSVAGMVFLPLDGNPRHGVLGLFPAGRPDFLDAVEILERQGRWLVMPDPRRARQLGNQLLARPGAAPAPRASTAATPDRRYVFFNALREGGTCAVVERRKDGGAVLT